MLKKIIAVGAIFALFACSGKDNWGGDEISLLSSDSEGKISSSSQDNNEQSSSSSEAEPSSSSSEEPTGPQITEKVIAGFLNNAAAEENFGGKHAYGYTLKASSPEDLTLFWNMEEATDENGEPIIGEDGKAVLKCPLFTGTQPPPGGRYCYTSKPPQTDAILQNTLTSQHSPLHYVIHNSTTSTMTIDGDPAITLMKYNLKGDGDLAALALDITNATLLNGISAFAYKYNGGTHKFRAVSQSTDDVDFWYYEIPKTETPATVIIPVDELTGVGLHKDKPFDISKVVKFMWLVEYDSEEAEKNEGDLFVNYFKAQIPEEE
ncbi:MAG: hypothetical protein FWB90_06285 [Fibromonadales bacterium]|nr:hypothetical protein [Fibromonadales bacterium]